MKRFIILLLCSLALVTPVSASASHTYHAEMISRNFSSEDDGGRKSNQKADKWVDHISDLSNYHISSTQSTKGKSYGFSGMLYINHVTLIKKHETHYQKHVISLLEKIRHWVRDIDPHVP